jgi:hypothetical protein
LRPKRGGEQAAERYENPVSLARCRGRVSRVYFRADAGFANAFICRLVSHKRVSRWLGGDFDNHGRDPRAAEDR